MNRHEGLAVAALVSGVLAIVFAFVPLGILLAVPLAVLAIVFGAVAHRPKKGKWGLALGAVSVGLAIAMTFAYANAFDNGTTTTTVGIATQSIPEQSYPTSPGETTPAPQDSGPYQASFGEAVTLTAQDGSAAALTVARPAEVTLGEDSDPPTHGKYVAFKITFKATAGTMDYNAFDWYLRQSDGSHQDSDIFGKEPMLNSGTLHTGETVTGYLTFDSTGHGTLVYDPNPFSDTGSLAEWGF